MTGTMPTRLGTGVSLCLAVQGGLNETGPITCLTIT
jgi:hypothetical protein